jgi:2-succinyl-6-hydroxy-2,4-cyclohexadiene-1-carboxylate synthase
VSARGVGAPQALVLLHGFGGTRRMWDGVVAHLDRERYRPLALDLPGHGQAASYPGPITFDACVAEVLRASPERFALCGYSMGGRIAMHVALAAPERVTRLILIASSPGIESARARAQRRAADRRLARELEDGSHEGFVERWNAQALFAADPPDVVSRAREEQLSNDPVALATAMRGIGTGEMEPLWQQLPQLQMPVLLIAGRRDVKFKAIGERAASLIAQGELLMVAGGHRLVLESPEALGLALSAASGPRRR